MTAPAEAVSGRRARWLDHPALWAIPLAVALLWARRPLQFRHPQLWAEDGPIFFQQAFSGGSRSLVARYAGYHHLVPRVVAYAALAAPIGWTAAIYALASGALAVAVVAYALSRRMPFEPPVRLALALVIVAVPLATEVFLNLTNLQWFLALALLLLAVSVSPATPLQRAFDVALLVVAGLTGPFALLFLPCFGVRWWSRRDTHSLLLLGIAAACAAAQTAPFTVALLESRAAGSTWASEGIAAFVPALGSRAASLFFGFLPPPPPKIAAAAFAAAAVSIVLVVRSAIRQRNVAAAAVLLGGGTVLAAACAAFHRDPAALGPGGDRYFFVPAVALLWAIVLVLPRYASRFLLVLAALSFIAVLARGDKLVDYDWPRASSCIGVRVPCVVPINPPGWQVELR